MVKPRVLRRISQLSNHSTPRSYRSIIQSQHNTSYFEIKAGLKALEFGVMFSFATDNCVLSVVFSSPPPPRPPPCFCLSPCCWCLWLPPRGFMKCICVTLLCCMLLYCVTCCVGVALIHPLSDGRSYTLTSKRQSKGLLHLSINEDKCIMMLT